MGKNMRALIIILIFTLTNRATSEAIVSFDPSKADTDLELIKKDIIQDCGDGEKADLARIGINRIPLPFVNNAAVTCISLAGNRLETIPEDAFHGTPNLMYLDLSENKIPVEDLFTFGHNRVRFLNLSYQNNENYSEQCCELMSERNDLPDLLRVSFPSLEYLDLSGNRFPRLPVNFQKSFPRLTHLYLADRHIGDVDDEVFQMIPLTLKSLHLEKNGITRVDLPNLANVEELYLDGNIYLDSIVYLQGPSLKILSLSNCNFRSLNNSVFANIGQLTSLDLSRNYLGFLPMDAFTRLTRLQRLDLSHNQFTEFPNLTQLRSLLSLSLSYNYISNIMDVISLPWLSKLSLRGNRISIVGPYTFSRLQNLQHLDLSHNQLKFLSAGWMPKTLNHINLKFNLFPTIMEMSITEITEDVDLYVRSKILTTLEIEHLKSLPDKCRVHVV